MSPATNVTDAVMPPTSTTSRCDEQRVRETDPPPPWSRAGALVLRRRARACARGVAAILRITRLGDYPRDTPREKEGLQ